MQDQRHILCTENHTLFKVYPRLAPSVSKSLGRKLSVAHIRRPPLLASSPLNTRKLMALPTPRSSDIYCFIFIMWKDLSFTHVKSH